jgi:hypothetical protein
MHTPSSFLKLCTPSSTKSNTVDVGYYALVAQTTLNLGVPVFYPSPPYQKLLTSLLQISKRVPLMVPMSNPNNIGTP